MSFVINPCKNCADSSPSTLGEGISQKVLFVNFILKCNASVFVLLSMLYTLNLHHYLPIPAIIFNVTHKREISIDDVKLIVIEYVDILTGENLCFN